MQACFCTPPLPARTPFVQQKYPPPARANTPSRNAGPAGVGRLIPPGPDNSRQGGTTSARLQGQARSTVQKRQLQDAFSWPRYKLVQAPAVFADPSHLERLPV